MGLADLMGMKVISSSAVPVDMVVLVRNGETLHRFVWTANALADQEREIQGLRAERAALARERDALAAERMPLPPADWTGHEAWVPLSIRGNAVAEAYHRQTQAFVAAIHDRSVAAESALETMRAKVEGLEKALRTALTYGPHPALASPSAPAKEEP